MKIIIATTIFVLIQFEFIAQTSFKAEVSTSYESVDFKGYHNQYVSYNLMIGNQFINKLDAFLDIGLLKTYNHSKGTKNMNTLKLGLFLSYRFFEDVKVSPKISIAAGLIPYTNLMGEYVDEEKLAIISNPPQISYYNVNYYYSFIKWNPYLKPEFLLSLQLKQINLDLGVGIPFYNYKIASQFHPEIELTRKGNGISGTLKVGYLIGGKK